MKDSENLYDKIRELIGQNPDNVSILEEVIDVELQMEYFECSKSLAAKYEDDWALDQIDSLHDDACPLKRKKKILARLATLDHVIAFRAIESYVQKPDKALRDWSLLALQESRMHLESSLLEENQILISTGLGGRGNKLRYFVVLVARNRESISSFQERIIDTEFPFVIDRYEGEIEDSAISGYLATFTLLLPIQYAVKELISEGIRECNQFGEFLRDQCIVTNVKKLTFEEVERFIERKGNT